MGGLNEAIAYARKKAKIKDARVVYYPKKKEDPFDAILEILEDQESGEILLKKQQLPQEFLGYYEQLLQVEQLNGIQMRLPYVIKID